MSGREKNEKNASIVADDLSASAISSAAAMQGLSKAYPVKEGVQDKQQTDEQQEKGTGILEVKITSALPLSAASQVTVAIAGKQMEG